MNNQKIATLFSNGTVEYESASTKCSDLPWAPHPVFEGVSLKHLLKNENSGGALSCHIVSIEPGCRLEEHIHEGQWELHEVIEGEGSARLEKKSLVYSPGRMAVIPKGSRHTVEAGEKGLVILAKFFPGLL